MDREKLLKAWELFRESNPYEICNGREFRAFVEPEYCMGQMIEDTIALLKEQEAKPPVHIHEEYPEHDWKREKDGDIDVFAFDVDFHNGPVCNRCYYSFCIHCDPDGWNKKPCIIDEYKCPKCGRRISKGTKFCSDCGQVVKW